MRRPYLNVQELYGTLDNITMTKHLVFYGFLLLRRQSSVGGLIYLLRCLLFTAWHTNCNTNLVRSFLLVKMVKGRLLKKHCFQRKLRSSEQFPHRLVLTKIVSVTFKFTVSSLCFMYSVGVCCTYLHVDHSWLSF